MFDEDEFTRQLGARLHADVADVQCVPGLTAVLRRRQARRTLAVRAAVATPVAAAVAVATVALHAGTGGTTLSRPGPSATSSVHLPDVAYVSARTRTALASVSTYVLYTRSVISGAGISTESWEDMQNRRGRDDRYRANGSPLDSFASTRDGTLIVDYPERAWWTISAPAAGLPLTATDPAAIRDALADGSLHLVGEERVNGQDALHLRLSRWPGMVSLAKVDLWVDATTYLPYRQTIQKGPRDMFTVDFTWLPRTAANLAHLELTPPAGFTHRSTPILRTPSGGGHG